MLEGLNEPQREAVLRTEGPLLLIAGAGSGKTRVLTTRIAYLIRERGVAPESILAFTFTNKAAREMRDRVEGLAASSAGRSWIGTFHATGVRILRRQAHRLGYPNGFTIFDAGDSRALITSILKDVKADPKMFTPKGVAAEISRFKNDFQSPEELLARALTVRDEKLVEIYREYGRRLKANGSMDFDDLIARPVELFEKDREVQAAYSRRFEYVLVDEFQDTNPLQLVLIRALSAEHGNLFAVGDDDQAIYSWRGATIDNMLEFESYFSGAHLMRLEQNYRSTSLILRAANEVISHNRRRKGKTLWSQQEGGDKIELWWAEDGDDEGARIRDRIRSLVAEETAALCDVVILYRTNAQSRPLEDALRREGIPYQIVGGTRFFERREVRDLLAYLRLVVNPADAVGFARIVNVPRRGLGKTTVERLFAAAREQGMPPLAVCQDRGLLERSCPGAAAQRLAGFARLIADLTRLAQTSDAATVFKQLLAATGYEDWLRQDDPATAEERRENVAELFNAVHAFVSESDEGRLEDFLESVSLLSDIDSLKESGEMVTLMTMHTAKGLEFPYVFIAGCEEGLLPHATSMMEGDNVEEERRLFYVALTRARRRVFISAAASRRRFGSMEPMLQSRFLRELPEDCVTQMGERETRSVVRMRPSVEKLRSRRRPHRAERSESDLADLAQGIEAFRRSAVKRTAQESPSPGVHGFEDHEWNQEEVHFTPGLRERHELLGEGTVEKVEGLGELTRLTISFGEAGSKKILARYARITVLDQGEAL